MLNFGFCAKLKLCNAKLTFLCKAKVVQCYILALELCSEFSLKSIVFPIHVLELCICVALKLCKAKVVQC